jgi:CRP-like cAMP-binding protein
MSIQSSRVELVCASQQSVFLAGESGPVWRVVEGIVRIDRVSGQSHQPVQLALPGDLIGTEALCGQAYQFSAVAFTPCKLEAVRPEPKAIAAGLLQQALLQQMTRSLDMAHLRSGTVVQRLGHLLSLMPREVNAPQPSLPALREVALLVDAKTETVCRVLGQLLPGRGRPMPSPSPLAWAKSPPLSNAWAANHAPIGVAA